MYFELKCRSSQMNLPCQNKVNLQRAEVTVIPLSPRLFCKKTWKMLEGWMTVSLVKLLWKKSWTTQILLHGKPSFRQIPVLWLVLSRSWFCSTDRFHGNGPTRVFLFWSEALKFKICNQNSEKKIEYCHSSQWNYQKKFFQISKMDEEANIPQASFIILKIWKLLM